MRIGFDAKRAFFNFSGLGNYSRNTISCLGIRFPENDYLLYIPKRKLKIRNGEFSGHSYEYPKSFTGRKMPSFWRSYWLGRRLAKDGINLYHGLSNEIPFDLPRDGVRSVVTIHDLIYVRFPEWYKGLDRKIYLRKAQHASRNADRIIAISEQTKSDIIEYLGSPPEKIDVVYQGCDPMFYEQADEEKKILLKKKYALPENYLLYVGTIEPRKNLLKILESLDTNRIDIPLIIIGRATAYIDVVRDYIERNSLRGIQFLRDVPNEDLPGIYQMAEMFIYPSVFEGFGIPILEALASGTPVITSRGGVFPEAGGVDSVYVDPGDPGELGDAIRRVLDSRDLQDKMKETGLKHALKFKGEIIADNIMSVYRKIL